MPIDDHNSIYVGGLPYDSDEETLRDVFGIYGAVINVKIINDHTSRGKCYGFVTFANPRSAVDAINDMDGRTINGRVVKVNEVTNRGGRSHFNRERHRPTEWERGHDRERKGSIGYDRNLYRDRSIEHERYVDRDEHHESREYSRDQDRDRELSFEPHRPLDGSDYDRSVDEERDQPSRGWKAHSQGLSSDSSENYDQAKKDMDRYIQRREELKQEIAQMEESLDERQRLVIELKAKAKTLEDAMVSAKKLSSKRHAQLYELHKCFLQVKDNRKRLKYAELELETQVESTMQDIGESVGRRNSLLSNGIG